MTNKKVSNIEEANFYLQRRGPDKTTVTEIDNWTLVHNLLSITGDFTPQPLSKKNVHLIYNGEIYNIQNESKEYKSDGYYILDAYDQYGDNFFKHLDGEFAIALLDLDNNKLIFGGDLFLTKPLFIGKDGNNICISSYKSAVTSLGFNKILRAEPNMYYIVDLKTFKAQTRQTYEWNLDQHIDSYEVWKENFYKALKKRVTGIKDNFLVPVSSGHDSGGIICGLKELNIVDFMTYSFTANEAPGIIEERVKHIDNKILKDGITLDENIAINKYKENYVEPFFYGPTPYNKTHEGFEDKGGTGLLHLLKYCRNNHKIKVQLSGQGADEVMTTIQTYGFNSPNPYIWPENLSEIFPWGNFYYGANWSYLNKEECIAGSVGIETRYPFLDKKVVQSFINLTANLKNKYYKAPLHSLLTECNFPFVGAKRGFDLKIS
tara:strand:+ start:2742 stop:4040 length:1299 start_codon:yes stop_codon:yes gene_type:complete